MITLMGVTIGLDIGKLGDQEGGDNPDDHPHQSADHTDQHCLGQELDHNIPFLRPDGQPWSQSP